MTYVVDRWNLYVCKFLNEIREYKVGSDSEKTLMERSHLIETVLFVSNSPDEAYEWAIDSINKSFDQDHDGKFDLRQIESIGIIDIDNLQINLNQIETSIKQEYGCIVDVVNISSFDMKNVKRTPDKSSLTLFKGLE